MKFPSSQHHIPTFIVVDACHRGGIDRPIFLRRRLRRPDWRSYSWFDLVESTESLFSKSSASLVSADREVSYLGGETSVSPSAWNILRDRHGRRCRISDLRTRSWYMSIGTFTLCASRIWSRVNMLWLYLRFPLFQFLIRSVLLRQKYPKPFRRQENQLFSIFRFLGHSWTLTVSGP